MKIIKNRFNSMVKYDVKRERHNRWLINTIIQPAPISTYHKPYNVVYEYIIK